MTKPTISVPMLGATSDIWGILPLDGREDSEDYLLALDPGGTTGGALYMGNKIFWFETQDILTLWNVLSKYRYKSLIFEKFVPEVNRAWETSALEVQGIAKLWKAQGGHLIWQYRHQIKTDLLSDDLLKYHRLWVQGAQHARDAIKHILLYLIDHGDTSWLDHLKPSLTDSPTAGSVIE